MVRTLTRTLIGAGSIDLVPLSFHPSSPFFFHRGQDRSPKRFTKLFYNNLSITV